LTVDVDRREQKVSIISGRQLVPFPAALLAENLTVTGRQDTPDGPLNAEKYLSLYF